MRRYRRRIRFSTEAKYDERILRSCNEAKKIAKDIQDTHSDAFREMETLLRCLVGISADLERGGYDRSSVQDARGLERDWVVLFQQYNHILKTINGFCNVVRNGVEKRI